MAGELESALGGVYSVFTQEFQMPLVMRVMDRMTKDKRLPEMPKDVVKPMIVTGLEALGRGQDLQKYTSLLELLGKLGPTAMAYLNMGDLIKRGGTALMIDMGGLIKTDEEMAQGQQQAQQQAQQQSMMDMAGKAAPAAVKAMSDASQAQQAGPQAPTG